MSSVVPSVSGIFATDMAWAIASRSRAAEQIEGVKLEMLYRFWYFVVVVCWVIHQALFFQGQYKTNKHRFSNLAKVIASSIRRSCDRFPFPAAIPFFCFVKSLPSFTGIPSILSICFIGIFIYYQQTVLGFELELYLHAHRCSNMICVCRLVICESWNIIQKLTHLANLISFLLLVSV